MTDADRAREVLAEVERRRGEAARLAFRRTLTPWYVTAVLAVLVSISVLVDLRDRVPGWDGWFARWGVIAMAVLVLVALGWVATRRAGLSPRAGVSTGPAGVMVAVAAGYLVVAIGVGMPLRLFRVPWDQTISAVCAAVVAFIGWAIVRTVVVRRGI